MEEKVQFTFLFGPNRFARSSTLVLGRALRGGPPPTAAPAPASLRARLSQGLSLCGLNGPYPALARAKDWIGVTAALVEVLAAALEIDTVKTKPVDGGRKLAVICDDLVLARLSAEAAVLFHQFAEGAIGMADWMLRQQWDKLKSMAAVARPGVQREAIARCSGELGAPYFRFSAQPQFDHVGEGRRRILFDLLDTSELPYLAGRLAADKAATNQILAANGLPVARQAMVTDPDEAWQLAREIGLPVVVKPRLGNRSRGLTLNVASEEAMATAFAAAAAFDGQVVVESFIPGTDFRIYVVHNRLVGAVEHARPSIAGDGIHSVRALVEEHNRALGRLARLVSPIALDEDAEQCVKSQGLTLDAIAPAGLRVHLSDKTGNYAGGFPVDRTEHVHPANAEMLVRATQLLELDVAGIDFRIPDITRSWREVGGGICEVNTHVGFKVLLLTRAERVTDELFSPIIGRAGRRIPHLLVIGGDKDRAELDRFTQSLGKQIESQAGWRVGLALSTGLWLDGYRASDKELPLYQAYRRMIENPLLDAAIYCCTPEQVERHGFGLERAMAAFYPESARNLSGAEAGILGRFVDQAGARRVIKARESDVARLAADLIAATD